MDGDLFLRKEQDPAYRATLLLSNAPWGLSSPVSPTLSGWEPRKSQCKIAMRATLANSSFLIKGLDVTLSG